MQLELDKNFYNEETRCDYLIDNKMKKIWAVELDLLNELLRVCRKHNIKVFAFAGTLLGAVRHKGFIPWDDDVDVCMLRGDYNKLLSIAENEFKHPYFFQTAETDKEYFIGYARLRNSNTTGIIKYNNSANYNNGIYIDVFVLDGYSENKGAVKRQLLKRNILDKMIGAYHTDLSKRTGIKRIGLSVLKKIDHLFFSYEKLLKIYDRNLARYTTSNCRVSLMTHPKLFLEHYWCNINDFRYSASVLFEEIEITIPANYDGLLKNCYGNYLEFPPIEKRGIWHENIITYDPDIPYKEFMYRRELK